MNKIILNILVLMFLIISSCEEPDEAMDPEGTITIISPYDGKEFIYMGQSLEIITEITNKESAYAAYIYLNENIIASGLSDTLLAYYEPNSNINQNANIQAVLVNEQNQIISSDDIDISINSTNSNTLNSETVFMNVDNEFNIMRTPVTNRQFLNFLNSNEQLNVEIVDIIWTNIDNDSNGDPSECQFDSDDNYEPKNWWYVTVSSNYANDNIPSDEYVVYRNAYNIYDSNADYSQEAGRIRYDCETETFYLPLESDGSESIYLDHPVVGVSWIGANIYANYFGWNIPNLEQWELAAKGSNPWIYPWIENNTINENYANYNNSSTSEVKKYNGIGESNLSLSAYGLYDMAGNVWEYTSSESSVEAYIKTGGAFDSEENELEIGYEAYALWEHVSFNTGFRCIANTSYDSYPPSGCMDQSSCNYDSFAAIETSCFEDDCLDICGGDAQEFEFFQDLDNDGLGNPEVSEMQCNEPEDGWVDNNTDVDDNCTSNDFDCNSVCNGEAFIDGCGECVGGTTGNEACTTDCNGDDGGSADWDDCNVCSGGNTGHEANSDMDCNGDCFGTAIEDSCGICSGGNTDHVADSDLDDCGVCFGNGSQYYCTGTDVEFGETGYGCCSCNSTENSWEDCSIDTDVQLLCEDELEEPYAQVIFGCANENAVNYYCEQENNECVPIAEGSSFVKPPCNLINDGCIIYGCPDDGNQEWSPYPGQAADNFDLEYSNNLSGEFGPTTCSDESLNDCCQYTSAVLINIGAITENTMEILIDTPHDVGGFQFNVIGSNIVSGSGGAAENAGFTVSAGGETVLGFSFTGSVIPEGTNGLLINLQGNFSDSNCLNLGTGAISNEIGQELPANFGDDACSD